MKNNKGQFGINALAGVAITVVVVAMISVLGLQLLGDIGDDIGNQDCAGYWNETSETCQVSSTNSTTLSSNTEAFNATGNAIEGVAKIPEKLPLIVGAVVLVVTITIIIVAFKYMK